MEDEKIIKLYWERDERAILETKNRYGSYCYSIAFNILSILEDAEECVNDTYYKVWNSIPPEKPNFFRVWLGTITRNLSINRWHYKRAEKRFNGIEILLSELSDCIPDKNHMEIELESKELANYINNWLENLTKDDRLLFIARYWNGERVKDLGLIFNSTPNKLSGRLFRLRKSLKSYLVERGVAI